MKIPRLRSRKPEFRRRRVPQPAARRLLFASLASGLILLVALAIVFLPIALRHEGNPTIPLITLESVPTNPPDLIVTRVTAERPLSDYLVEYWRDNDTGSRLMASIGPLQNRSTAFLSFRDMDGDGNLSERDEFTVAIDLAFRNRLLIFYTPAGKIVGGWPPPS